MWITYLGNNFLFPEFLSKWEVWLGLEQPCSNNPVRLFTDFSITKRLGKYKSYLPCSLQSLRWVRMSCFSRFSTDFVPYQIIPDDFICFTIQISLSFHLVTFFTIFQAFILKSSELEIFWWGGVRIVLYLRHNSRLSNCNHIRVNVCAYKRCRRVLQKKIK